MRKWIIYCFLILGSLSVVTSCTNDETDEGLETLTPNEPNETSKADSLKIQNNY